MDAACFSHFFQDTIDDYLNGWNDEEEEEQFSTPIDDVDLRVFFYDVSALSPGG